MACAANVVCCREGDRGRSWGEMARLRPKREDWSCDSRGQCLEA